MGRGGARPGAGRKPNSGGPKNFGRFVYVMQQLDDASACKIGVAIDPPKLVAEFQRRYSRAVKLVGLFSAPSNPQARQIERAAKASMTALPGSGEWFRAAAEQVAADLHDVARCLGIDLIPEPVSEIGVHGHGGRRPGAGRRKGVPNRAA
jgi:hypothetical protein